MMIDVNEAAALGQVMGEDLNRAQRELEKREEQEAREQARERERDRSVFSKLHGGRQPRAGSRQDGKTAEIINMYENQRRGMEAELASLRRDVINSPLASRLLAISTSSARR